MENASDAILMAGAMLIFVLALAVAMTVFSQARATVDAVLYESDPTNYYEYLGTEDSNGIKNRVVGLETIIPTLYKYYKENYTVIFLDKSGNKGLPLYKTQTDPRLWSGTELDTNGNIKNIAPIVNKYPGMDKGNNINDIQICSFDVDEETKRHEPWTGSTIDYKENIDCFLKGGIFKYPDGSINSNGSEKSYNYSQKWGKGFVEKYKNATFRETIGEYSISLKDSFGSQLNQGIRNNKNKRVIVYQLLTD